MVVLLLSGEVALRMGCILSMVMMVGIAAWSIWNTLQEGVRYLNRLHQVPCSRCVYFTGDYRLKCPVHPISALTEEAIDCRDYEARGIPICPASRPAIAPLSSPALGLPPCSKTLVASARDKSKHYFP